MRETGEIIQIQEGGRGIVRLDVHGGCDRCGLGGACHITGTGRRELTLDLGDGDFRPGDLVEVETAPGSLIAAAFTVFILPLALSMLASGLVFHFTGKTGWSVLGFFLMFGIAELGVAWIDRKLGRKTFFEPRVIGKAAEGGS
ncbi:MAG TPA: hypothetical protein ENN17_04645 [bacterium]|nr:hypothetical protein [bacterium]